MTSRLACLIGIGVVKKGAASAQMIDASTSTVERQAVLVASAAEEGGVKAQQVLAPPLFGSSVTDSTHTLFLPGGDRPSDYDLQ